LHTLSQKSNRSFENKQENNLNPSFAPGTEERTEKGTEKGTGKIWGIKYLGRDINFVIVFC
jgi:hypothetical protein